MLEHERRTRLPASPIRGTLQYETIESLYMNDIDSIANKTVSPIQLLNPQTAVLYELDQQKEDFSLSLPFEHEYLNLPIAFRHKKDMSITRWVTPEGNEQYYMILSVNNRDDQQDWQMRSLIAESVDGEWRDNGEVVIEGVSGPELCAAGVESNTHGNLRIVVQTQCFSDGGVIIEAESIDGKTFTHPQTVLTSTKDSFKSNVYDAEPVTVTKKDGTVEHYFTVTCVGNYENGSAKNGAIYLVKAPQFPSGSWELMPTPLFTEYSIPPHIPTAAGGEWVPEGGKMLQIEDKFLFYGTCFQTGVYGTRQRGFFAIGDDVKGPFTFLGTVEPFSGEGETGHGTILVTKDNDGEDAVVLFNQTRQYHRDTDAIEPWTSEKRIYRLADFLTLEQAKKQVSPLSFAA